MKFPAKFEGISIAIIAISILSIARTNASSEIDGAISPDQKYTIKLGECNDFGCNVELQGVVNAEVLSSIKIEAFDPDDSHCRISAHWRKESAAVALNIDNGRSITDCVVFVFGNGKWRRLELPENEMQRVRDANNEEGGKSLEYLTFTQWTANGVQMHYQGNRSETDLTWRIVDKPEPHLERLTPVTRARR